MSSKGLGKGLGALIPNMADTVTNEEKDENVQELELTLLRPNPYQPRKEFRKEALEELAESMKQYGVVQPLVVRKSIHGYEIVAGERRFRAAQLARLEKVPVIVRECDDDEMMEIALIENLQREDLNPIEIASAYQKLLNHFSFTQEELAKRVGKSRSHLTNFLRLLQLPLDIQEDVSRGTLSMGHARALLAIKDIDIQKKIATKVKKEQLSVRELETLIQKINEKANQKRSKKHVEESPMIKRYEDLLQQTFHTPVKIRQGRKKGKIEIEYYSEQELERLMELLHSIQGID